MDIGARLRQLRQANDLTLEELASRSELTKGFLSQVERNITSPSISSLEDILEALGTDLSHFFNEKGDEQIVFGPKDWFVNENDEYTIEWVVPNAQKNAMEPILLTLKPQASYHQPAHAGEEFGYLLNGSLTLEAAGKKHVLAKGETFCLPGDVPHTLTNTGLRPATLLWVTTPPAFTL